MSHRDMFDLTNKLSHIVTENAASMLKAFSFPGFEDVAPDVFSDVDYGDDDSMVVPCVWIPKAELDALYTQYSSNFVLARNEPVHATKNMAQLRHATDSSVHWLVPQSISSTV